jgi:hypothetical protein
MIRNVLGVLGGLIVWVPAFLMPAWVLIMVWPDYAAAVGTYRIGELNAFTPAMSVLHALFWILAEVLAGWLAVVIARRRAVAYVLAALMFACMSFNHLYSLWDQYPWWYNLGVVIPVVPAVLMGATLADGMVFRPVHAASDLTQVKPDT